MEMSFGKHKGEEIEDLPNWYLEWLLLQDWFEDKIEFEEANDEYLDRKKGY